MQTHYFIIYSMLLAIVHALIHKLCHACVHHAHLQHTKQLRILVKGLMCLPIAVYALQRASEGSSHCYVVAKLDVNKLKHSWL
jgi:hypothetical protein